MSKKTAKNGVRLALVGLLAVAGINAAQAAPTCNKGTLAGVPRINAQHIFCSEIGSDNKAKGFHSRPGGSNPDSVSNTAAVAHDASDIYVLKNFTITQGSVSKVKDISTMFPDNCTEAQVIAAIRNAYATKKQDAASPNRYTGSSGTHCQKGKSPAAFDIVFYLNGDLLNTAYPK